MSASIRVTVVHAAGPRDVAEWALTLAAGSTVRDAVTACDIARRFPGIDPFALTPGVWNRRADWGRVLGDGDRVELWRPLRVDPKVARLERFRAQGTRAAGLFARKRPGAKPGY